jgi:hypothetical protein
LGGFLLVCLGFAAAARADRPPSVDSLATATFQRVMGTQAAGSAIDVMQAGDWGSYVVGQPTVDFDGTVFRMWFAGTPRLAPGESPYLYRSSIGLATSQDGVQWTVENGGQPVFTHGPAGSFDSLAVSHPSVLRVADGFLMWYGGADGSAAETGVRVERLGLAKSADGINWVRQNGGRPVLDIGPAGAIDSIQATGAAVIKTTDGFRMWYGAFNGLHTLGTATSRDGTAWTKDERGAVSGLPAEKGALGPAVYAAGRQYLMLYSVLIDGQWKMVAATSADGWTWVPAASRAPLLGGAAKDAFDSATAGNHSVHPSEIIVRDERVWVWYSGEDARAPNLMRIGLMEAKIGAPH